METVGDLYMAASGVSPERPDHAQAALMMALDLHTVAATVMATAAAAEGATVQLRVGLHSGPVRGGLIGNVRARFCLFGDVVNTASRMESTADAGAVQVSQETFDLLGLDSALFLRQERAIKGKGPMTTFSLRPASPEAATVRRLLSSLITDEPSGPGGRAASPLGRDRGVSTTGGGGAEGKASHLPRAPSGVRWEAIAGGAAGHGHAHHGLRDSHSGLGPPPFSSAASVSTRRSDTSYYAALTEVREKSVAAPSVHSAGGKSTHSQTNQAGIVNENMEALQEKTLDLLISAVIAGSLPGVMCLAFPHYLMICGRVSREASERYGRRCDASNTASPRAIERTFLCTARFPLLTNPLFCPPRVPSLSSHLSPYQAAFPPGWLMTFVVRGVQMVAVAIIAILGHAFARKRLAVGAGVSPFHLTWSLSSLVLELRAERNNAGSGVRA